MLPLVVYIEQVGNKVMHYAITNSLIAVTGDQETAIYWQLNLLQCQKTIHTRVIDFKLRNRSSAQVWNKNGTSMASGRQETSEQAWNNHGSGLSHYPYLGLL